jgi:hypothetical protein
VTYGDGITAMAASCDILHLAQSKQVCKGRGFCGVRFCAINLLFDDFGSFLFALLVTLKYL